MTIFTRTFWRAAGARAIHTVSQTAVATIGTTALIEGVDWRVVGSASVLAGMLSLLKSVVVGTPEVPESGLALHE